MDNPSHPSQATVTTVATVATVPTEEADEETHTPDDDWGSNDDRARLARDCADLGQFDTAEQIAKEIQDATYQRNVLREIARAREAITEGTPAL